jgi:hypothetical protein
MQASLATVIQHLLAGRFAHSFSRFIGFIIIFARLI